MGNKVVLFLLLSIFAYSKEILLLHSYHKGYVWTNSISEAVEDSFRNTDVVISTEFMDTKRTYSQEHINLLFTLYQEKYKNKKFDLIIASDNNALSFLEKYHDKIFQDVPIVFCGINNFEYERFNKLHIKNRTTGVLEAVDIKKNINLIFKLHPNVKKLLVLNDQTVTGQEMKREFFEVFEQFKKDIDIEYIDKFRLDRLKERVKNLDKDTVILYIHLIKDETGKIFNFKNGLIELDNSTDAPIYGLWDFYLNHGIIGGFLTNGYGQGRDASALAKEILNGKAVSEMKIIKKGSNRYIFDHKKLEEYGIDEKQTPRGSLIKNKPFSFYETYKMRIMLTLLVFLFFIMIIVLLVMSLVDKRKARNEYKIQLHFIEALLNTIKNPISYKDKEGKYIGCNNAFCEFFGHTKDEIIGKSMEDFFGNYPEFLNAHMEIEKRLFNNEEIGEFIMEFPLKNGELRSVLLNKSLYYDLSGNMQGILSVLHDITEFVEAQKEKKQNESFLAQQSKLAEIGEMISAIAHQWNEPLVEMSAIVQDLDLQYQKANLSKKDIDSFVSDSMVQIQYMSKTLKDFRDFLKPSVKKSHFNIKDAFDEVLNILERQIKYSYIDLKINYEDEELNAYGYKNEFMQVLITIINNAKDAIIKQNELDKTHKGKLHISVTMLKDMTQISICDNGCGIKDEDKDKVFDPYYSTKSTGNGLGLYMSKVLICDKMDGKIYFSSESKDTSLIIELPKDEGE